MHWRLKRNIGILPLQAASVFRGHENVGLNTLLRRLEKVDLKARYGFSQSIVPSCFERFQNLLRRCFAVIEAKPINVVN